MPCALEKGVASGMAFGLDNPESRTAVRFANKPQPLLCL